eukprot:COSAG02_NODE_35458_length_468_cov_0.680217_1_plen_84_part_01
MLVSHSVSLLIVSSVLVCVSRFEENTMLQIALGEAKQAARSKKQLCSAVAQAARAQTAHAQAARARLSEVKTQVLAELKAFQEL